MAKSNGNLPRGFFEKMGTTASVRVAVNAIHRQIVAERKPTATDIAVLRDVADCMTEIDQYSALMADARKAKDTVTFLQLGRQKNIRTSQKLALLTALRTTRQMQVTKKSNRYEIEATQKSGINWGKQQDHDDSDSGNSWEELLAGIDDDFDPEPSPSRKPATKPAKPRRATRRNSRSSEPLTPAQEAAE